VRFITPAESILLLDAHVRVGRYSLFHVVAAYTNAGLSLVDTSLIPFQQSKLILLLTTFLVLAGNTAFVSDFRRLYV